jgi:hypothetical protein
VDFSGISFNKDHTLQAAARDAATGLKLIALAACLNVTVIGFAAAAPALVPTLAFVAVGLVAVGAGAYGAYLAAHALDWPGFITIAMALGALVPYLRFICLIVLAVFSIDLIRNAGDLFFLLRGRCGSGPRPGHRPARKRARTGARRTPAFVMIPGPKCLARLPRVGMGSSRP